MLRTWLIPLVALVTAIAASGCSSNSGPWRPTLTFSERAVILGDSYSSGDGAGDYQPESPGTNCQRSPHGYGPDLFGPTTVIVACAGARVRDIAGSQQFGSGSVPPQLDRLRTLAESGASPQVAILTLGGNDVDFGKYVQFCLLNPHCETLPANLGPLRDAAPQGSTVEQALLAQIAALEPSLTEAYRHIDSALNSDAARHQRDGEYAPVIVLGYPRILPLSSQPDSAFDHCANGITADEGRFFNTFLDALNTVAERAAGNAGKYVVYTDAAVNAFQPNHTACDPTDRYVISPQDGLLSGGRLIPGLLHPNAKGYQAMAHAIHAWAGR